MKWSILIRCWKHSTSPLSMALWDKLMELFLLGGWHGNKTILFHAVPPLACFSPTKFGYAEITNSYISMTWYPGNPKPCQLNNTQWRTPGWWKLRGSFDKIAPVSLWTASVEIMMALVRGIQEVQKGFCDFESEWQHRELSPVFSSEMGCYACCLFVASLCEVYGFIASNGSEFPSLASGRCARAEVSEVNRACSVLNLSNNGNYHQPCDSRCVWWQSDCTVGHGFSVSASPPGVPEPLSCLCYLGHWTLAFLLLVLLLVPEVSPWSPGMKRCKGVRGVSRSIKVEHVQRGLKWFKRLRSGEAGGNMKAMHSKKRWGNYRSNSVGKQNM